MKVALLLGANPKKAKSGPFVKLGEGSWRITSDKHKDTLFMIIYLGASEPFLTPISVNDVIPGPCQVKISIHTPGSELFVNLFAEKI